MVFVKLLGLIDIFSVIILILFKYGWVSKTFMVVAVIYLMIKGIMFFHNIVSLLDFGIAIVFILAIFGIYNVLTWIAIVWLLQKAILSLFS
ncbi:MAG: hypothetical protein KKA79_08250 [Nanoarchaeota archaeon]|nr:hypothetical protein [Nanoarchaeota archaeon]